MALIDIIGDKKTQVITVTVDYPGGRITPFFSYDFGRAEDFFISKRDNTIVMSHKEAYDRIRAIIKAASCFDDSIIRHRVSDGRISLDFKFGTERAYDDFMKHVDAMVKGAVVTTDVFNKVEKDLGIKKPEKKETFKVKYNYLNLTAEVDTPYPVRINSIFGKDFQSSEDYYIMKREEAKTERDKVMYDRARAIVKAASVFRSSIYDQRTIDGVLKIIFAFETEEELKEFEKSFVTMVNGATMSESAPEKGEGLVLK